MKKAAMFGLDARIALAIFGALSVISGAALYSAIGNSKSVALLTEIQEIGKAWEQYYLDTGGTSLSRLSADSADNEFYIYKSAELVEDNGSVGWNGPYLNYKVSEVYFLDHPQYYNIGLSNLRNNNGWNHWPNGICESGYTCSIWIHINGINDISLVKKLDILVDGIDDPSSGNLRYITAASPYFTGLTLRYAPIKNLNN